MDSTVTVLERRFADIDEVEQVSHKDLQCFEELRAVLAKYDALDRFGVALLHQHFEMSSDEVLVETIDSTTRTLTSRPMKVDRLGPSIETTWYLGDSKAVKKCVKVCPGGSTQDHYGYKVHQSV